MTIDQARPKSNYDADVLVIGGGPAGMMAAGRAAARGLRVILVEKNDGLGKKLLITGGGRCNVTNATFEDRKFLAKLGKDGDFLFSTFSQMNALKTIQFFNELGMDTKIEAENRVFPASNMSRSVLDTLVKYMRSGKVDILCGEAVTEFGSTNDHIDHVVLQSGKKIRAKHYILATGGRSHPYTGSTGDGFVWLKKLGHVVSESNAALVPISVKEHWIKDLAGLSINEAKVVVSQIKEKRIVKVGKILFTHVGLSGPAILNISRDVGELLKYGEVNITIDILPSLAYDKIDAALQNVIANNINKKIVNSLGEIVPSSFVSVLLDLAGVSGDTTCNSISREQRITMGMLIKHLPLTVKSLLGDDDAIVTSGGVSLKEVDFKTMRSRIIDNLYLVGDILDINRPSGGYSLQICWSTGYVAGNSVGN